MIVVRCPQCNNENPDDFAFCLECGTHVSSNTPKPFHMPAEPYWEAQHGLERQHHSIGHLAPVALPQAHRLPPASAISYGGVPRFVFVEGPSPLADVELASAVITIGRSHSNDVVLDDTRASRQHARVLRTEQDVVIEDLGSRNGTSVNGGALHGSQRLNEGDRVKIGETVLRLELAGGPAPTPHISPQRSVGEIPVVFAVPWSPIRCPQCHSHGSMRPLVFGPAAMTSAARQAAERGEIVIGGAVIERDGPNAECGSCQAQVRILPATPE